MNIHEEFKSLQDQLKAYISTKTWIEGRGKEILARIDEIEKIIQDENALEDEVKARMQAAQACLTGECE